MNRVRVDGGELEVVETGGGEPLVLVHGSTSDHRTWKHQVDPFSRRYRVVRYSRRYHWPNDPIPEGADYSMGEHVDDLEALLRVIDAAPAHLVGHSYGAFVCLLLALRRPDLVRTLVLAEPPAITLFVSDPPGPVEMLGLLARRPRTALTLLKFGFRGVGPATAAAERGDMEKANRVFGQAVLGKEAYAGLSEERLRQVRDNTIPAELLGSGFPPVDPDAVGRMERPTLLVSGAESPALFHRVAERLDELLPDHERVVVPGASHIMHEDDPATYNEAVLDFLRRRGGAS